MTDDAREPVGLILPGPKRDSLAPDEVPCDEYLRVNAESVCQPGERPERTGDVTEDLIAQLLTTQNTMQWRIDDLCRNLLAARAALRPVFDILQLVGEARLTLSEMPCECGEPDEDKCGRCVVVDYVEEILGCARDSTDKARACLPPDRDAG